MRGAIPFVSRQSRSNIWLQCANGKMALLPDNK
jgi:hypothetical protein